MTTQATDRLVVVDGMPSVTKLWNDRFRLEFFCTITSKNEDWYSENIDSLLPAFGNLQSADFTGQGWGPVDGEAYPDMRLVEAEAPYIAPSESHLVKLTYETLTDVFVQEKDDDIDYELNGLKRVSQSFVALPEAPYTSVVGTTTLDHDGTTLYLASFKIIETDAKWTLQEVWLEAGKISESESNPEDGIKQVTERWWKIIGTTVGPIISKSTDNFQGFQIYTTTSMTGPNGEDLSDENTQVADFETLVPWTRPGVIAIKEFDVGTIGAAQGISIFQNAPVQMNLRAHVEIFFSKDEAISDADFDTITGGTGVELWNPPEWAKLSASGSTLWEAGFDDIDRTYRGFRVIDPTDNDYSSGNIDLSGNVKMGIDTLAFQNGRYFGRFSPFTNETANDSGFISDGDVLATGTVSGGPDKPEGKIWMIDIQNPKAFTDIDGVDYYKKTFVWSYVPDFENGEDIWDDAP